MGVYFAVRRSVLPSLTHIISLKTNLPFHVVAFSESSLGRLLQALEMYILILYILISTFYKTRGPSRISAKPLDIEEGNKDQDANLMEKVPALKRNVDTQADTSKSFLPISAPRLPQRFSKYRSAGSWTLSMRTDRDNDTDDNSGMLSVPGSSILSPSRGSKRRLSLWLSEKRRSERSLKSMSGFLGGTGGGRIRSVSWEMLNDPMQEGSSKKGPKSADTADTSNPSMSNQALSSQPQLEARDSLKTQFQYRLPFTRIRAPPLAGRLERLATELNSVSNIPEGKGQTIFNAIPVSSVDRTSESIVSPAFQPQVMSDSDEFHLTPVMPAAPGLYRSPYYEVDPDPDSYDKSIRSSISDSTAEIELFLRQQQAGLEQSIAELRLLEGGGTGLDIGDGGNSMTSDFTLSEFPGLPVGLNQSPNTYQNEQLVTSSGESKTSFGNPPSPDRIRLSFPSPVIRTSGDSSVLGVNEAMLTLGLGTDPGVFTRGESSTRQLDVTSFIAAGGEGTDSLGPRFRPATTSIFSPPSLSGTEDAEGTDTPPPSIVRFATRVHVPPVTSVSVAISRSLSGSKSDTASSAVDGMLARPTTAAQAHTSPSAGQAHILSNRPLRRKIGIGLPSSVKLSAGDANPFPGLAGVREQT